MAEESELDSRHEKEILIFPAAPRLTLGPTKILRSGYWGTFLPALKWQEHEVDHHLRLLKKLKICDACSIPK